MLRRLIISLAGLLAVTASAVVVETQLPYKELRLKDGTVLANATVKSFNTASGTALILVDTELVSVRTTLLPDEAAAKIRELTPALSKEEQEAEKKQAETERAQAAARAERRQQQAEDEAKEVRATNRALSVKAAEKALDKADPDLAEVTKAAEARARTYFKYESQPGSTVGAVVDANIQLDDPEPVPGWTGRYRVCGTANRQFINNRSSAYDRDSRKFEILVDTAPGKKPKVVDLTVK